MDCREQIQLNGIKAHEERRREAHRVLASFLSYLAKNGFRIVDNTGRELRDKYGFVDGFIHKGS